MGASLLALAKSIYYMLCIFYWYYLRSSTFIEFHLFSM